MHVEEKDRINERFFTDNTLGMHGELAERYRAWAPMIQEGILEFFPRHQSEEFLAQSLGFSREDIDVRGIEDVIVKPTYAYIDRPGKLLRPVLTALFLNAYGGDVARYRLILSMVELMEVTTISLNDIWDDSLYRRDGYCTHILHNKEIAHTAGLAGFAYCLSLLFNKRYELDDRTILRLYRAFAFEEEQMFLSEVVETLWPFLGKNIVEEKHFFQEIASRCAFLSFRGPARIGAILGGASDEDIRHIEMFGMLIGLAFHLRGDNLNFSPQSKSWGKVPYEDITAGRRSLLTSYTYLMASPEHKAELIDILSARTTAIPRINRFIEIVNLYKATQYCESRATELLEEAKRHLEQTTLSQDHKTVLLAFADFMVRRKK